MSSLHAFFKEEGIDIFKKFNKVSINEGYLPCSGLTAAVYPMVKNYLNRTGFQGGGSELLTELSKMLLW